MATRRDLEADRERSRRGRRSGIRPSTDLRLHLVCRVAEPNSPMTEDEVKELISKTTARTSPCSLTRTTSSPTTGEPSYAATRTTTVFTTGEDQQSTARLPIRRDVRGCGISASTYTSSIPRRHGFGEIRRFHFVRSPRHSSNSGQEGYVTISDVPSRLAKQDASGVGGYLREWVKLIVEDNYNNIKADGVGLTAPPEHHERLSPSRLRLAK